MKHLPLWAPVYKMSVDEQQRSACDVIDVIAELLGMSDMEIELTPHCARGIQMLLESATQVIRHPFTDTDAFSTEGKKL